jgi:hypothetical protein
MAIHFPSAVERLLSSTPLEYKLIRFIISLVYLYELPHSVGQAATTDGSASWIEKRRLSRFKVASLPGTNTLASGSKRCAQPWPTW